MSLLLLFTGAASDPNTVTAQYGGDQAELYAPTAGYVLSTTARYGGDQSAVYAPSVLVDGVPANSDPTNRLKLRHYATKAALAAGTFTDLDESRGRGWKHRISDVGSFTCEFLNTDPDVPSGGYVQYVLDGTARFLGPIEGDKKKQLDKGENDKQTTSISGRGVIAEWDDATVQPPTPFGSKLFDDVRLFGWMSPELDDSGWDQPFQLYKQSVTDVATYSIKVGSPLGWPDPDAYWIWSEFESDLLFDPATSYFRAQFTVAADDTVCSVYLAADDAFTAYIDGVSIGSNGEVNGWKEPYRVDVTLDSGTHDIAIEATNFDRLASTNTAGVLCAIYSQDNGGNDDTLLLRSNKADWKCLHDPADPPGFTVGEVVDELLTEWQALNYLSGWTKTFDGTNATDGAPWPTRQQFSFRVGAKGLSVLRQLSESHIDYDTSAAGFVLHAYKYGEAGVPSGSASVDLTSNLESLEFDKELRPITELAVRYQGGWILVSDAAAIAEHGYRQDTLSLGDEVTEAGARALGEAELARFSSPIEKIKLEPNERQHLSAACPYLHYRPGDFILAPNRSDVSTAWRVLEFEVEQDDATGQINVEPTLNALKAELGIRLLRTAEQMTPGTLDGRSAAPSFPGAAESARVRSVNIEVGPFSWMGTAGVANLIDQVLQYPFQQDGIVARVQYSLQQAPAGASPCTVVGKIDGTPVWTHIFDNGQIDRNDFPARLLDKNETLTLTVTAADASTIGLVAKVHLLAYV